MSWGIALGKGTVPGCYLFPSSSTSLSEIKHLHHPVLLLPWDSGEAIRGLVLGSVPVPVPVVGSFGHEGTFGILTKIGGLP